MRVPKSVRPALAGLLVLGATAAVAQGPAILNTIAQGEWRLHEIGVRGSQRSICVRDPRQLLQVRHGGTPCARFVIADGPRRATVRYTCPGRGYGMTTITVESDSVVRLQTQGLFRGAPFDLDYEARRQGPCRERPALAQTSPGQGETGGARGP